MSSDDMSINSEPKPSTQIPVGSARHFMLVSSYAADYVRFALADSIKAGNIGRHSVRGAGVDVAFILVATDNEAYIKPRII